MKLLQLIDEIKVVSYGGPVVSISATFLSNDELDEDYFTQPQWDFKVLTLREAKLELDKFQRTNSADAFELPLAIDPEFREMGYSLGNAVACLPRPTRGTYYELDGFPGEGYGYQSEYGGRNPGQEWRHGVIFVRVFHPVEITGEDFDSLNEYIDFSVYLGSKISFLEAFTRLASKSEINEIAVIPSSLKFFKIPINFTEDYDRVEYTVDVDDAELVTYQQLQSDLNTYSNHERVIICKGNSEEDANPKVRFVLCLPKLLNSVPDEDLPGSLDIELLVVNYLGSVYMSAALIDTNLSLAKIGDLNEIIDIGEYRSESAISPQQALQYLKGINI